jgi:nitrite reductase/ring-hydroxylating ferredoxin subunit
MSDTAGSRERHQVATTDELSEEGDRVLKEVKGTEIAVFNYDGEFYAVTNYCIHQAGPLCEGDLTGDMTLGEDGWSWEYDDEQKYIRCPWHGWVFDITSGQNTDDPRYQVPTYDVEVDDDQIYVLR